MTLIGGHLTRLFDFSGRENRKPFWLWVLIMYLVTTVASIVVMVPLFVTMFARINQFARDHPDQAVVVDQPGYHSVQVQGWHPELMPNLGLVAAGFVMLTLLVVLLVAAAVVRRLHDGNRSGYWALPYLVIQLLMLGSYGVLFPRFFTTIAALGPNPPPDAVNTAFGSIMPLFLLTFLVGMVGSVYMIILVIFLATRGTIGPNRYGDDLLPPPVFYPPPQWQQPAPQWQPPPPMPPPPPARVVGQWEPPPGT